MIVSSGRLRTSVSSRTYSDVSRLGHVVAMED